MALREILAKFGFEVDTGPLDKAAEKTDKTVDALGGLAAAVGGAALIGGLLHFTQGLVEVGSELDDQSNRLGVSSDALQAWRFTAGQAGASAEEAGVGLRFLSKNLADAAEGGAGAEVFQKLGIKIRDAGGKVREATDVIGDVADALQKTETQTEKTGIALKIFGKGGAALLPVFAEGSKGIKEMYARFKELGGGYSKEFVRAADAAGDAQAELGIAFASLKSKIGVQVLPLVTTLVNKITDLAIWIRKTSEHTNIFRAGLGILGTASILTGVKLAAGVASKFGLIQSTAGAASGGILGTVSAFGQLVKAGANVGLKIALVYLVLEDLYTLFTGGHSAIGALIDGFFGFGASAILVQGVKDAFFALVEVIKLAWPALVFLGQQTQIFLKDMFTGFKGYGKMFSEFFEFLWKDITNGWNNVIAGIVGQIDQFAMSLDKIVADHPILGRLTGLGALGSLASATGDVVGTLGATSNGVNEGRIQQTNQVNINVSGAGSPEAVADKVAAAQKEQLMITQTALGALARP